MLCKIGMDDSWALPEARQLLHSPANAATMELGTDPRLILMEQASSLAEAERSCFISDDIILRAHVACEIAQEGHVAVAESIYQSPSWVRLRSHGSSLPSIGCLLLALACSTPQRRVSMIIWSAEHGTKTKYQSADIQTKWVTPEPADCNAGRRCIFGVDGTLSNYASPAPTRHSESARRSFVMLNWSSSYSKTYGTEQVIEQTWPLYLTSVVQSRCLPHRACRVNSIVKTMRQDGTSCPMATRSKCSR